MYYDHIFRGGIVSRDGFTYNLYPNDVIGRHLYTGGHPALDELQILKKALGYFESFIDIGANIGSVSVPIAKWFDGPVLALEPVRKNFERLCENLRLNGVMERILARRVAVGDSNGTILMHLSGDNSGDHRAGEPSVSGRPSESVELRTLADCISDDNRLRAPFLVKIDVQGFEARVIAGAAAILTSSPCLVLLEFWPEGLRSNGCSPADLFRLLAECGLRIYEVTRPPGLREINNSAELGRLGENFSGEGYCNLVATNRRLEDIGLTDLLRA
ncbi:MAG: FkbM family methyltransferase [Acidobacteriota bacterium]|nr:FkbM family methyltransferase [Acidobacteriota bacterium]